LYPPIIQRLQLWQWTRNFWCFHKRSRRRQCWQNPYPTTRTHGQSFDVGKWLYSLYHMNFNLTLWLADLTPKNKVTCSYTHLSTTFSVFAGGVLGSVTLLAWAGRSTEWVESVGRQPVFILLSQALSHFSHFWWH
jgi:hypothetical protein